MSMMTFFPWFTVAAPVTIGKFKLFPHKVGAASPHGIPASIDRLAKPYRVSPTQSVREICVLQYDGKPFDADLSEDDRTEIFAFAEALTVGGLATRRYFQMASTDYTNKDTLACIIQGFTADGGGFAITSRLRYGRNTNYYPDDVFLNLSPPHVHPTRKVNFDVPLVEALLKAMTGTTGERFEWAIFNFNRANTDSSQTTEQAELVLSTAAFETLFKITSGKADDLATAVYQCLSKVQENGALPLSPRLKKEPSLAKYPSVRHLWILDMYKTRNSYAHGAPERRRTPAIWATQEHLLLTAFIFTTALKIELEREGHYTLTKDDLFTLTALDYLLRVENLFVEVQVKEVDEDGNEIEDEHNKEWSWNLALKDARWAETRARAVAAFNKGKP